MTSEGPDTAKRRRRGRLIALAILTVCAIPFVVAVLAYNFFPPSGRLNYGELVEAKKLAAEGLKRINGESFSLDELHGRWVLLQADRADCDPACREKLFDMRQARLAQGKDRDRVERLWLLLDDGRPPREIAWLCDGVVIVQGGAAFAAGPLGVDVRDHIFLVDPLGRLMLRFPKDADPKRMIKDLERLLRVSRIG
jgi:cytochrome oxidase Cu insertion factor (SCO1/SenC/PrrC family)